MTTELQTILTDAKIPSRISEISYIGTESLLYAIAYNSGLRAYQILEKSGIDMKNMRNTILKRMNLYNRKSQPVGSDDFPLTPAAEGVLALVGFERGEADSISLLSAILKAENTEAARVLYSFKITYPSFYQLTLNN